jgi:hypothetical protein
MVFSHGEPNEFFKDQTVAFLVFLAANEEKTYPTYQRSGKDQCSLGLLLSRSWKMTVSSSPTTTYKRSGKKKIVSVSI